MNLSHDLPCRASRLLFTAVLALSWCQVDRRAAAKDAAAPGAPAVSCCGATPADVEPTAETLERLAAVAERRLAALAEAAAAMPRDTFDPAAVVASAGREPEKLLAWVRANTAYAPYRGVLRGPAGVLMDRTGNSLDRALLLAELVTSAGGTARLARATLDAERARTLASRPADVAPAAPAPAPAVQQGESKPLHRDVAALLDRAKQRAEEASRRVADQASRLVEALGHPAGGDDAAQAAAEAAADHWWVQCRAGGAWVDLDPAADDGKPGATLTPAVETFPAGAAAGGDTPRFDLPAGLHHEVVVRVIVERSDGAQKAETAVLEHALRPADVAGRRVTLRNLPLNWPDADGISAAGDPAARLKEVVLAQTGWAPVLTVAGRQVVQRGFTTAGDVIDDPQPLPMAATGAGVKKGVGAATGLFGSGDPPPAAKAGVLSAAWVEFETHSPGRPARPARREVFDLVGPARRAAARAGVTAPNESQRLDRGLALLGQTDVLVSGCDLSPQFVSHAGLSSVAAQRETIVKALRTGAAGAGEEGTDPARRLEPFPVALYSLAVSRRAWDRPAGAPAGVPRRDVYVASPNVFCQHSRLRHDAREGVVSRLMLDVVHNDMAVRPGGGGGGAAAFAARVRQGVLDTNAEALVLANRTPRVNTADLYDAAKGAAGAAQWVVLRNAGDAGWSKLSALPADVKARITQDVAAGYWAVVAPPQRAAGARRAAGDGIGWWRIDPLTGTTVGIGASGHGISFAEYAVAAGAIVMGVIAFGGCGGFDRATGHGRRTLCLVCGVVAGGLALAFLGEFAAAMATTGTLTGGAAATAMGEFVVEGLCAAVDWASS